ncbi:hypothetical protein T492DRAFT_836254 [Pavlovales sp. CCMP2436]|nr:hypothetical protein T492DRAFT_836254 [Pavlovales sp. CCMP2436]
MRAQVRQDLLLRLRALDAQDSSDSHLGNGNGSNLAPLLLVCRGYGGEEVLERRVTVKFLPPAQLEDARARKAREAVAQQASGTVGKALSLSAADKAEALAYAQTLAAVHAQALPELQRLKLVDLDLSLGQLQVRLLRQFQFAGNAATYESDADEEELLDELAVCLHLLGQALGRRGEGPLYLALEGHTANAEPKEYNETLSLQRAERVRADLLARLQKLGASSSSLAAAGSSRAANGHFGGEQARIVCRGYGGSQMRRRCVEVRVLSPAEARAELGETAPADGAVAGAAAGTGGEHAGPDFGGTWALESSNGLDNFLKTMGVGPLKRKLADGFRPTQEWSRGAGGSWQLAMLTPTGEQTEVLPIELGTPLV